MPRLWRRLSPPLSAFVFFIFFWLLQSLSLARPTSNAAAAGILDAGEVFGAECRDEFGIAGIGDISSLMQVGRSVRPEEIVRSASPKRVAEATPTAEGKEPAKDTTSATSQGAYRSPRAIAASFWLDILTRTKADLLARSERDISLLRQLSHEQLSYRDIFAFFLATVMAQILILGWLRSPPANSKQARVKQAFGTPQMPFSSDLTCSGGC
mmetsp:Transcript_6280/g.18009  ORF Transcript_6280/g.18009 Transcript_6280/m.18009 type:complete len:211 (-) Transcript_6280:105-737(-)